MDNLWHYFKNLFVKAEQSSPSQPLIHELIQRSEEETLDYERWKKTLVCRRLVDWLDNQYAVYRVLPHDVDEGLDFLHTPSSKGFVVHFNQTRYSRRDATHFFDYLKEQVLTLGYRPQISDTRTYHRSSWVETVERHYLKPRPHFPAEGETAGEKSTRNSATSSSNWSCATSRCTTSVSAPLATTTASMPKPRISRS
jgi:hypothetical protein